MALFRRGGDNSYGQTSVPVGLSNVVAVDAGTYFSLALRADGTVTAWGHNGYGQTSVPAGLSNVTAVAAGNFHCLALRSDGVVVAWGNNDNGRATVPPGLSNVVAVAASLHNMALRADGTIVAWGYSANGETNVPVGLSNVFSVASGAYHSLAANGFSRPFISPMVNQITAPIGSSVFLQARPIGIFPMSCRWQKDGVTIDGATNALYTALNITQPGAYCCIASNVQGVATGMSVYVTPTCVVSGSVAYVGGQTGTVRVVSVSASETDGCLIGAPSAFEFIGSFGNEQISFFAYRDSNGNGTQDYWEACGFYTNNPIVATSNISGVNITLIDPDHDGDGQLDYVERVNATDPYNSNSYATTISGLIELNGCVASNVHVRAMTSSNGCQSALDAMPDSLGRFQITNVPTLAGYWIKAFEDINTNGVWDALERYGGCNSNPIFVTNIVTNVAISLGFGDWDGDGISDDVEVLRFGTSPTNSADPIQVDDDGASDPGPGDPGVSDPLASGTCAHPFDSIQKGINVASNGMTVLVLDGFYSGEGNRDIRLHGKRIKISSFNGPDNTVIEDNFIGFICDSNETIQTVISGFTIHTWRDYYGGAGVTCVKGSPTITNCVFWDCGQSAVLVTNNASPYIVDSIFIENNGGIRIFDGSPRIERCMIISNAASQGAGIFIGDAISTASVVNCLITQNRATVEGGGVYVTAGAAPSFINCTIAENSAVNRGGGMFSGGLALIRNCIIYSNTATASPGFYLSAAWDAQYNCLQQFYPGIGNTTNNPNFKGVNDFRLGAGSAAIDTASMVFAPSNDLRHMARPVDGDQNGSILPDMGVYEMQERGAIRVWVTPQSALSVGAQWSIDGGEWHHSGEIVSNILIGTHVVTCPDIIGHITLASNIVVEVRADSLSETTAVYVAVSTHYVALTGQHKWPFDTWIKAATNVQSAVDSANTGSVVWVTNGLYVSGGVLRQELTDIRVMLTRPIKVRSVNGPEVTLISGSGTMRCAYLTEGSSIEGFTLRDGITTRYRDEDGGGAYCTDSSAVISNCIVTANVAETYGGGVFGGTLIACRVIGNATGFDGFLGGGVYGGTIYNSLISSNSSWGGGGCANSTMFSCLVVNNSAYEGGGAYESILTNCTLVGNKSYIDGSGTYGCTNLNSIIYYNANDSGGTEIQDYNEYCCIQNGFPGTGSFTNEPMFVNYSNGDFRLSSNSLCINAGTTTVGIINTVDYEEKPRIANIRVDIGAYESDFWGTTFDVNHVSMSDAIGHSFQVGGYNPEGGNLSFRWTWDGFGVGSNASSYTYNPVWGESGLHSLLCYVSGDLWTNVLFSQWNVTIVLARATNNVPLSWLAQYGLTNFDGDAVLDIDHDGMTTWQEWLAGCDPTNSASVFRLTGSRADSAEQGMVIRWPSISNRFYDLSRATNLLDGIDAFMVLPDASSIPATPTENVYTDFVHGVGPYFYKVIVHEKIISMGAALIPSGSNIGTDPDYGSYSLTNIAPLYMDKSEVTKAQWDEIYMWAIAHGYVFDNTGSGKATDHPVQIINWFDCIKWCNARSEKEGRVPSYYTSSDKLIVYKTGQINLDDNCVNWNSGYRLPTAMEWEFAARGGASSHRFPWSDTDTIQHARANYVSLESFGYDTSPTRGYHPAYTNGVFPYTSPVGSFPANGYGLYDMTGNVWEWCWSWDPGGIGSSRMIRGGSWGAGAGSGGIGGWYGLAPDGNYDNSDIGFRTVRHADP